ncbi:hypothetical protein [Mangrovactinospora gilvigrisea]|uniref:hypothetical protein n=1 Tax=Mangrovactinospora gilvigrisea TaxID=1428644 RepID=UPI0009A0C9F8|nr:hypothetical protein [Mangrovactinospora gilvigrisea]
MLLPLVCGAAALAAVAAAAPPPPMSIAVTDGVDAVRWGSRLTYHVTLKNQDSAPLHGVRVEQRLPDGAREVRGGGGGRVHHGTVVWRTDLAGRATAAFTASAVLGRPDGGADGGRRRTAGTVCAYVGAAAAPAVCAADTDELPAVPGLSEDAARTAGPAGGGALAVGAAGAGAAALAGVGFVVWRRRAGRRAEQASDGS